MKRLIVLAFLLLIQSRISAQEFVFGRVIDKQLKTTLSFVSIGIQSKGIGTNTNEEGKFQLLIPENCKHDTIQFSMIGYETLKIAVRDLMGKSSEIQLGSKVYSLEEVTIRSKKLTADDVIKTVIRKRDDNYNANPFKLEAYYREIRNVDKKYDHLIEVALNTFGKSIDKYFQKVEILNSRKIDHVRFEHEENLLNSTLRLDYIANNDGFIKLSDFKENNYRFEDVRLDGNKNIYIISSGTFPGRKYTFYINEEDYAIIRIEMEDWYAERGKLYMGPIDKTHTFRLKYFKVVNQYKMFEGKYYPDYISVLWDYDKYNTTTKSVYENSYWLREFRVNQVFTKDFDQPDPAKLMSKLGSKIDDQMTQYDAQFWENYNVVPLTSQQTADLESKGALVDQFIKNADEIIKKAEPKKAGE